MQSIRHRQRPCSLSSQARTRGFTLVELMVVIVIIGLLATVVMINVMPSQDRAMVEKARADVAVLEQALETYRLDNLSYPSTEQGLQALLNAPSGLTRPGAIARAAISAACRKIRGAMRINTAARAAVVASTSTRSVPMVPKAATPTMPMSATGAESQQCSRKRTWQGEHGHARRGRRRAASPCSNCSPSW